ncbi:MAG: DNA recombination protein RmuC [Oligoflexia bacterium]|nr:DNA recombination protein RmuC [Oligoflexia bacterium]
MELTSVALILLVVVLALQIVSIFVRRPVDVTAVESRVDVLGKNLQRLELMVREDLKGNREELSNKFDAFRQSMLESIISLGRSQSGELSKLTEGTEKKLELVRATLDTRVEQLQKETAQHLDKIRGTVDEKLQGTLEKRLGDSFKIVSERLELVHKGLGEMQSLATGVGDLKRVLTNVKTRGTWGEVQLGTILSEILTPSQYSQNVKTNPGSSELVEFAVRLPGRDAAQREAVWIPVDSKFPIEDYHRLIDAQERGDVEAVAEASKNLETRIRQCAKDISSKYISPPHTTDFGFLFVPVEGLYAEIAKRPGLLEVLMRDYRVVVGGPSNFAAFLNAMLMGFRTLAIEQRSSEVWSLLGAVKTEFAKFGNVLDKVKDKLESATSSMADVATRSRQIERKLRKVEALPEAEAPGTLALTSRVETEVSEEPEADL